jgi:Flp pilus assembly protein TadG
MVVVYALTLTALVGGVAFGTDLAIMYSNWAALQKAVDAAALAGANYLPEQPSRAQTIASNYATANGVKSSELSTSVSNSNQELTVSANRTVPYYFAKVLGLSGQAINVTASAMVPGTSCIGVGCTNPGSSNPTYGTSTGQYGLVPIGLQSSTSYVYNTSVQLAYNGTSQTGQWGPGNWGYLQLGSPGGMTLRQNIANGYSGPLQVGNYVNSQTGLQIGTGGTGLQDRINAGLAADPTGTFSSHTLNDARVLFIPLVDWNSPNGASAVEIVGFASLWLDSVNGQTINAHFISQVAPESLPNTSSAYAGTRGAPILIK